MHIADDAVNRLLELLAQNSDSVGIRITAEEVENQVSYQVYWEEEEFTNDIITDHDGLKVFMDPKSNALVGDTYVFITQQDGQEGLFIMKNTSDCATCSDMCY